VAHVSFGDSCGCCRRPSASSRRCRLVRRGATFAHTLLILLATQNSAPELGAAKAAASPWTLLLAQRVTRVSLSLLAWLADRFRKNWVLPLATLFCGVMALAIIFLTAHGLDAGALFMGGVYCGDENAGRFFLCDSDGGTSRHGVRTLATVNGAGDFLSSIIVGVL